jgi:NAD(P)-dependent dehydrogenase (short-subunit alcohol dehydrogenase family)
MSYNPYSLEGKTILVTGASSGIGRTTAIECSKLGARVILMARNEFKLDEVLSLLENKELDHQKIIADVTNNEMLFAAVKDMPVLDGCVSNAGIGNTVPVQFYTPEEINRIYAVNVFAPMMLVKCLVKQKKLRRPSSIVFTSSGGGVYAVGKCNGIYDSSKNALHAYMHVAALELGGKGIRVNSVNPAMVETEFLKSLPMTQEQYDEDKKNYVLGRYGTPQDVAYGIVFLLSDASSWITGTDLKIDGGRNLM